MPRGYRAPSLSRVAALCACALVQACEEDDRGLVGINDAGRIVRYDTWATLNPQRCVDRNGGVIAGCPCLAGEEVECYTGPSAARRVGACRDGVMRCQRVSAQELGVFDGTTCYGQVLPAATDTCGNNLDDNCNAQTDEAPCALGTYVCTGCAGASDTNQGTVNSPVKTITQGIANAVALGMPTVFVAGQVDAALQVYAEDVTIPDGVVVQGRWLITTGGPSNNWSRTAAARTTLNNTAASGVKFVAGATRTSGLDGLSIVAGGGSTTRAVGVSIVGASPLLKDFAVVAGALAPQPPMEAIGVLVTGGGFPRLEGVATTRSNVSGGAASATSVGLRVNAARVDTQFVNLLGGSAGNGLSAGVQLINAPLSEIRDATLQGSVAVTCLGLVSQGNAGGVVVENVNATGCPPSTSPSVVAKTGIGIGFELCPQLSGVMGPQVRNSTSVGGTVSGAGSLAIGAASSDGCNVAFASNNFSGGLAATGTSPETAIGLHCGTQGLTNMNGADAPCRVSKNNISAGSANAATAIGLNCAGSCGTKTAACLGSCTEVTENTIAAPNGKTQIHVAITDSAPFLSRNRIGLTANGGIGGCATSTVIGLALDGSGSTVVNNFISGGPCQTAVGISQQNDVRTGDLSIATPTVHFNTVVASGAGASPFGAVSVGLQLSSTAAVPAAVTPKGIYRNNILVAGPVSGLGSVEVPVRENDAKSDPATFWNNLLHANGGPLNPIYVNEGNTNLFTEAAVNAMTDISSQANLSALPFFANPGSGDYHLTVASSARGAGTATGAPAVDFDNDPRPTPAGSNPDIGADEIQ